jgi:hypothetical protein
MGRLVQHRILGWALKDEEIFTRQLLGCFMGISKMNDGLCFEMTCHGKK